ncbi:MAG: sugar transferase [Pelagibacterales bacterium]|nr:sugar transferase [Pelagibacterales bacterium]
MINRVFAIIILIILLPLFILISILIYLIEGNPIFFIQQRIGKDNKLFKMYKFRTMKINTPNVATHHLHNPKKYIYPFGAILRNFSIDELPNIINIVMGEMDFIGPRPALYNQNDLMALRKKYGIDKMNPGLSGWAQINGRDEISIEEKVELEKYYLENKSILMDIRIFLKSFYSFLPGTIK